MGNVKTSHSAQQPKQKHLSWGLAQPVFTGCRPGVVVSAGCCMHPTSSGAYEPVANMKYQPGKVQVRLHLYTVTTAHKAKTSKIVLQTSSHIRILWVFPSNSYFHRHFFLRKRFVWADLLSENKSHEKIIKPVLEEADKIGTPVTVSKKCDTFLSCHPKMYRASQYFWARWSQEGIHHWNLSILQFS